MLMSELKKMPIPAATATYKAGQDEPVGVLIVRGEFTKVNLGNKTKRMMIGLGRGASDVKAQCRGFADDKEWSGGDGLISF